MRDYRNLKMHSTKQLIDWCIQRYRNDGGEGIPDEETSGVTPTKIMIRDSNRKLLQEYDKDFVEFKLMNKMGSTITLDSEKNTSIIGPAVTYLAICLGALFTILYTSGMTRTYVNNTLRAIYNSVEIAMRQESRKEVKTISTEKIIYVTDKVRCDAHPYECGAVGSGYYDSEGISYPSGNAALSANCLKRSIRRDEFNNLINSGVASVKTSRDWSVPEIFAVYKDKETRQGECIGAEYVVIYSNGASNG